MTTSVVVATFNGEAYIKTQLVSILRGTQQPDEVIIVDDASTDGTLNVIQDVSREFHTRSITIIKNTFNEGVTASFFKAISQTVGDVVFLSDQDDEWMPEKLALMSNIIQDRGMVMVYSDGAITDQDLRPSENTIFSTRSKARLEQGDGRSPLEVASNPDIKGCTMAVRGEFARDLILRSDVEKVGQCWGHDHWLALFAFGSGKVSAVTAGLIKHRFHGKNTSAGTAFKPLSLAHWVKWVARSKDQRPDHFVVRYTYALEVAESYGSTFRLELKEALREMLNLSERRSNLKKRSFMARTVGAWDLYREGAYTTHYNGFLTLLRDVFL